MQNSISIPIALTSDKSKESVETPALIDCRAGGQFIDQNYARKFTIQKLDEPLTLWDPRGGKKQPQRL
jgi:hypothetical protein